MNIDRRLSNNFRFTNDIVLINDNMEQLKSVLMDLKRESKKVGLEMSFGKTRILTIVDTYVELDGQFDEYV